MTMRVTKNDHRKKNWTPKNLKTELFTKIIWRRLIGRPPSPSDDRPTDRGGAGVTDQPTKKNYLVSSSWPSPLRVWRPTDRPRGNGGHRAPDQKKLSGVVLAVPPPRLTTDRPTEGERGSPSTRPKKIIRCRLGRPSSSSDDRPTDQKEVLDVVWCPTGRPIDRPTGGSHPSPLFKHPRVKENPKLSNSATVTLQGLTDSDYFFNALMWAWSGSKSK